MAIYQFGFTVIPKSGVLDKYGQVPERLHIDYEAWEKYRKTLKYNGNDDSPNFEDALTFDWWKNSNKNAIAFIEVVDSIAKRSNWGNFDEYISWKNAGDEIADEDAFIEFENVSKRIKEFGFRFDLRFGVNEFLFTLLDLCAKNEMLLLDKRGNLIEPRIDLVFKLVQTSNAHRFVTNPSKFFDLLNKGIIKIE
ncbi:MAG: hypothetical protein IT258_10955 [Saprospiraceae bacterium]|nr:hypothetical protein [Saprospiraceae bacterium]